jgi:hypothetical protein
MTASPKLSRWFYEYIERNRRLNDQPAPPPPDATSPAPQEPRGHTSGWTRHLFTTEERQLILDLLKEHPGKTATVKNMFIQATGLTVSSKVIYTVRDEAIRNGQLPFDHAAGRYQRFTNDQLQIIIGLIKADPESPTKVSRAFAKACPGFTITRAGVCNIRNAAIKAGKLQL